MGRIETGRSTFERFLSYLSCCGGAKYEPVADHVLQPLALFNPKASQTSLEQLLEESQVARTRVYSSLGSLQSFTLTEAQTLVGAPRWPAQRQTFQVIRRPGGTVLLVSDGLSDPFDDLQADANVNGYGLEFFIETPDAELGSSPAEVKASWQFQLLYTVCSLAAGHGGIKSIIDDLGLLSTEAEGVSEAIPQESKDAVVNRASRVGALLGLTDTADRIPEKIDGMPLTDVRLVNIKLITLAELKLITELGAEGRKKLGELFQSPDRLLSSLQRPSVI